MPVQTVTYENDNAGIGEMLMAGAEENKWTLAADARIKTVDDARGVGPVVYTGRPKDGDGDIDLSDGSPRDAIFLFFKSDGSCVRGELFDQDAADITDTVADYLGAHGGDVTAMEANAPTVA